jgi:hypothetical protein
MSDVLDATVDSLSILQRELLAVVSAALQKMYGISRFLDSRVLWLLPFLCNTM